MVVQTSYSTTHGAAYAGMRADLQVNNVISKVNKGTAIIPYGKGVVTDGEDGAQLPSPSSTALQFNGVILYEINRAQADGAVAGAVPDRSFSVVTHGVVWVLAATAGIVKDENVFLRIGATNTGDFSNAAGSAGTLSVQIPGAKFLTAATNVGDLVKISFGLGG